MNEYPALGSMNEHDGNVSRQGCTKKYIICFLEHLVQHHKSVEKPPEDLVRNLLVLARQAAETDPRDREFGGRLYFNAQDMSSYWTKPQQFYDW
jgi:hypothetical protein